MKVSCVILNYNDSETALALAERLLPYESLHQIVLVDNASTDGSGERLAALQGHTCVGYYIKHYRFICRLGVQIARVWFGGIRWE